MNRIFKISFLLFAMFSIANVYGQKQPDGVSFQAVARDANGNAAAFRTIYVKLGIIFSISFFLSLNFIIFFIIESYNLLLFLKQLLQLS